MAHKGSAGRDLAVEIEDVPRRALTFKVTRRELFTSLRSAAERQRSAGDLPSYQLKTLGTLDDEELADFVPVLVAGCRLSISEGMVLGWAPTDMAPQRLCPAERTNLLILDAMNGSNSLGAIADQVRDETELAGRAFGYVRALFLDLVLARIATPK